MAEDICIPACRAPCHAVDLQLREANHRIANSLQAVMAASAMDAGADGAAAGGARLTLRISAIAVVHRLLSVSAQSDTIAIGDYLANLAESLRMLWSGPGGTRITVHHGGERVSADVAMRLGMVVNELVTNSFKYAYGDGADGEIRVAFSVKAGTFVLIVADDGRGIGGPPERRLGTGSRLVADIAKQLEASFRYQPARPGTIAMLSGPADVLLPRGSSLRVRATAATAAATSAG